MQCDAGRLRCRAVISKQVRKGCVWMPFHFADARANLLTVDDGDTVTGTAEYKVCATEVRPLPESERDNQPLFPGAYFREEVPT